MQLLHPDHVTVINFEKSVDHIENFSDLPKRVRDEILTAVRINSYGFQELCGYGNHRQMVFSAGGYWLDEKFYVTSYGSHNYSWDGTRLTNAIKEYV